MSENKHQLLITIGAALSGSFGSVVSNSTSKIKQVGGAIKDLEKQSLLSGSAVESLSRKYNSLLSSLDRKQEIIQKRGFYRSQIMEMVALGAALAVPIRSAMKFEDSLANIAAVVQFPEADGLQKLGQTLNDISKRVPKTADELALIAAIGGRFGVELKDLPEFTEELAKTAVAWRADVNTTAEAVGNLMKVFNLRSSNLAPIYDAINHLGNLTGATADNILKALNRSADGLANFKLSLPQAAALTSTIMSFGEGAEQAGSAVAVMLQKLSMAPTLGTAAHKVLHRLGFGFNGIAEQIQKNPQKVLDNFFKAVSKMDAKTRVSGLNAIFGRGAAKTVGKLVDNLDLYRHNLELINNAEKFKGSRNTDYDIVLGTLQAKLTLLTNNLSVFSKQIGSLLMPTISRIVDGINSILSPVTEWIKKHPKLTSTIVHIVAGLISARLAFFTLGYASTFLFGGLNRIVIAAKGLRLGLSLLGSLIFGKIGALALSLGAIFLSLDQTVNGKLSLNLKKIQTEFTKLSGSLKISNQTFSQLLTRASAEIMKLLNRYPRVKSLLGSVASSVSAFAQKFSFLKPHVERVSSVIKTSLIPNIKNIGVTAVAAGTETQTSVRSLGTLGIVGYFAGKALKKGLVVAFTLLSWSCLGALKAIGFIGRAIFFTATTIIPTLFGGLKIAGQLFWFLASEVIPKTITAFGAIGRGLMIFASQWLPTVWSSIGLLSRGLLNIARSAIAVVLPYVNALSAALGRLAVSVFGKYLPMVAMAFKAVLVGLGIGAIIAGIYLVIKHWNKIKEYASAFWDYLVSLWNRFTGKMYSASDFFKTIIVGFKDLIVFTYNLGKVLWEVMRNVTALIQKFIFGKDVIIPAWESIKTFFSKLWKNFTPGIDDFLKKVQQLKLVDGIMAAWNKLKDFFKNLWSDVSSGAFDFLKPVTDLWDKFTSNASNTTQLIPAKNENTKAIKLPDLKHLKTDVVRNQSNNFNITINAVKNDDSESITDKVMNRVSDFSKTFLYDPVPEVL